MRSGFTTQTVPGSQVDASSGTAVITSTEVLPSQSQAIKIAWLAASVLDTPVNAAQHALDAAVEACPGDESLRNLAHALREYRLFGVPVE